MRLQGKPWREIKEAIPHKNVYQKFKRLSRMMVYVNGEGHECKNCHHVHDIKVAPRKTYKEIEEDLCGWYE